jgi:dTDP-glucose 4,6-dehydratase
MSADPIIDEDITSIISGCKGQLRLLFGKTVLITGASGFVGGYLVETIIGLNKGAIQPCRLLLPTRDLSATRKRRPHLMGKNLIDWFEWDGTSKLEAPSASCDHVIHAASSDLSACMKDPAGTKESMVEMTSRVLEYAKEARASSFLYVSSGAVYGEQPSDMGAIPEDHYSELDPNAADACYGEGKRLCEVLCAESGLGVTIARPFALIGPYQDINGKFAVPDFIRQAAFDKRIVVKGDGKAVRGYCYASDLTIILWKLLLQKNRYIVYNVGSSDFVITIGELAKLVSGLMNNAKVNIMGKASKAPRSRYVPDIKRLKEVYTPKVDIKTALSRTIRSYRNRKIIP